MFEEIFREIFNYINKIHDAEMSVVSKYINEMCEYTVFDGKQNRAKAVVSSFSHLSRSNYNSEKMKLAHVIGCCIEIIQAGFLVHDDIMDKGLTRRNKRCWHLITEDKGYGLLGVNDGLYLQIIINKILKKYFESTPYYMNLVELFNDTVYKTCLGQTLDVMTSSSTIDWDKFTENRVESISRYKTSYYSFYLPVAGAMILSGETNDEAFRQAEKILLKIGEYFQVQDDFLDCFGHPDVIGKVGKDIEYGKCSWLVVKAMKLANDRQKSQIMDNYAKDDKVCVDIIKNIYNELGLEGVYKAYEQDVYKEIIEMIDELGSGDNKHLQREIFIDFLHQIYKRSK